MLTNLVIRQEDQLNINRQDTAFVLFVRADVQGSLAVSTFNIAKQWKQTKESNPEALKMPMRATLLQNIMLTVAARLEALLGSPEAVEKAKNLGWLDADNKLHTAKIHKPMA